MGSNEDVQSKECHEREKYGGNVFGSRANKGLVLTLPALTSFDIIARRKCSGLVLASYYRSRRGRAAQPRRSAHHNMKQVKSQLDQIRNRLIQELISAQSALNMPPSPLRKTTNKEYLVDIDQQAQCAYAHIEQALKLLIKDIGI